MAELYVLLIHKSEGISKIPGIHGKPRLYVAVDLDGVQVFETPRVEAPRVEGTLSPHWELRGQISSDSQLATLTLRLHHNSHISWRHPVLGKCDISIASLLEQSAENTAVSLTFASEASDSGHIFVHLSPVSSQEVLGSANRAIEEISTKIMQVTPRSTIDAADTITEATNNFLSLLGKLVSQIKPIVDIGDEIAQIHPYINVAWKVLTAVYQAVQRQHSTDSKLIKLVQAMVDLYTSVCDIDSLKSKIKSLERVVLEIAVQTVECSLFIREYTGHGFLGRLLRMPFSDTERKVDDLADALMKLKDSFDRSAIIQSIFISAEIGHYIHGLAQSDLLRKLVPAQYKAGLHDECLQGTCKDILTRITEWLSSPSDTNNIMWLYGVTGSGKSTVAYTVSQYFRRLHRLGAFVFFDRDDAANGDIIKVLHNIATRLAESNIHIRKGLCDALSADPTLVDADYRTQFQELLLDPITAAAPHICGPIVIVVDALDECGTLTSRKALVSLIARDMSKLPAAFRFLITSRLDSEIAREFETKSHIIPLQLDITREEAKQDILVYMRQSIQKLRCEEQITDPQWPGEDNTQLLATYAGGLFIWAATACKFLRGYNPQNRLNQLLDAGNSISERVDCLYSIALDRAGDWSDEEFLSASVSVLACVILTKKPLTEQIIVAILPNVGVAKILKSLGSVLLWNSGGPVRTLHASFSDYLVDPRRSGSKPWFIDTAIQSQLLATRCLRLLTSNLRFNICEIATSHLRNSDIPDLAECIEKHISYALGYAAQSWSHHLPLAGPSSDLLAEMEKFFKNHFLYWLEVVSLLDEVSGACEAVEIAHVYTQGKDPSLAAFVHDAVRFIGAYAPLLAQSMPHLYISALASAPQNSLIRQHYGPTYHHALQYDSPVDQNWSSLMKVLPAEGPVTSVAFLFPAGTRVASAAFPGTVHVWDAQTGVAVAGPVSGSSKEVSTAAFSLDGKYVVSGSYDDHTISVWDSQTGAAVAGPFVGHSKTINSVAFSPDSTLLVSGSGDCTVYIWDWQDGGASNRLFQGHTSAVTSVAFSPDNTRIVSGSADCTVRIWDSQAGTAGILVGHSGFVSAVAFSPDGTRIVSGSTDCTVRVWDLQADADGPAIYEGHTDFVNSVSHDGTRVVSGSADRTVRIWGLQASTAGAEIFEGHGDEVHSVAFSPDSTRVVSGSFDFTVRIWDTQSWGTARPFYGHTDRINSVAFSPDGSWVASASSDHKVCVWDSHTGAIVTGPFQHSSSVTSVAFSPNGTRVASGSNDGAVRVWDLQTGDLNAGPYEGHAHPVSSVAFSLDSTCVVFGSADGTTSIWNTQNGAVVARPFYGHTDRINSVALSPDGSWVASASSDHKVCVRDSHTGAIVTGPFQHSSSVTSVAFSSDGTRVVFGSDRTVHIWDLKTGTTAASPLNAQISSVAFAPDGTRVAAGSFDCTVCVCDSRTGVVIAGPFEGHSDWVNTVAFSPDGIYVVSGSHDGTVRIWDSQAVTSSDISCGLHPRFLGGWIMNSASDLIFWVPPWLRDQICLPWNTCVIGPRVRKLNWSNFVHGYEWTKCFNPVE
ncbi:WD40 repeat-like protein [Favolaschia claudopus]|uniref:WD40 repeat-like protein n=1 Tax=Favolaschia claudopus TaxID=2862362 RepID=A0AAW0AQU1_9AGAR